MAPKKTKSSNSTAKKRTRSANPAVEVDRDLVATDQPPAAKRARSTPKSSGPSTDNTNAQPLQQQCNDDVVVRKKLAAIANKLTDQNLESLAVDLANLYAEHPRAHVTAALTHQVLASVADKVHLQDTVVLTYAALLAVIGASVGADVVAQFVHACVTRWLELVAVSKDAADSADANEGRQRAAGNVLVLVGHLYNFQIISCTLVYDIFRELCETVNEDRVELVLKLAKLCGQQLRHDDPASLRQVSGQLTTAVTSALPSPLSFRIKFMLEQISDLAAGKSNAKNLFFTPTDHPLFKLARRRAQGKLEALRPTLDDIRLVKQRGMWWRVGSAWVGHDSAAVKKQAQQKRAGESELVALAKAKGMNTDVRRAVFVAVMGAEDYLDAIERIGKIGLGEKQAREVVLVVFRLLGLESTYNPYYTVLLQHLLSTPRTGHSHGITFQYAFWDYLNDVAGESPTTAPLATSAYSRRMDHAARALAHLIRSGTVPMAILRVLDPTQFTPHQVRFLRKFMPEMKRMCSGKGKGIPSMAKVRAGMSGNAMMDLEDGGRARGKSEAEEVVAIQALVKELEKRVARFENVQ